MKSNVLATVFIASGFAAGTPAQAQYMSDMDRQDVQGRVTFTLPFGGDGARDAIKSAPKLSLGLRTETFQADRVSWALRSEPDTRELNLSFTLDGSRSVLLNDQILFQSDALMANETEASKDGGLDTYDKTVLTVIGVSLAVIAGSIVILAD